MITLYASVFALISLVFDYLNYAMPDALQYYSGDPYSGGVSYEMASLVVLFPIFLSISHIIIKSIKADPTRERVWVRRWAIYLTLFAAGATIAGDLITLIMYFFNGDVTLRFLLKVLTVLLVAGGGFLHYVADLRGYWTREVAKARLVRWASGALVLITISAGFFIIGTPWQARLYRYDDQKVIDLNQIQAQVVNYYQRKGSIPASINNLNDSLVGYTVPTDPQAIGDESGTYTYEYKVKSGLSFELCATFNAPTRPSAAARTISTAPALYGTKGQAVADTWQHDAGHTCFERAIDPAKYPPLSGKATPSQIQIAP